MTTSHVAGSSGTPRSLGASRVCPELSVADVETATRWYDAVLGAMTVWRWHREFAAIRLGDAELYLVHSTRRGPSACYLHVPDVDTLYRRTKGAMGADPAPGGVLLEALGDREWAMREFVLLDPWENRLRIGHPLRYVQETPGFVSAEDDPRVP